MTRKLFLSTLVIVLVAASSASTGLADDHEAQQILNRAIKAAGGNRSLDRLKSPMMWMERGTFYGMGEGSPYVGQYAAKWPDWYRQEIENAFAISINVDAAWVTGANGVKKLAGADLEERLKQVRVAWAERLFPLTDKAYELTTVDGVDIDGRATVGINAAHSDGRDIKLFFDKQTYLIAKIETKVISPQFGPKPVTSETFYTDHKSFAGVLMPSKYKLYYGKKLFVEGETVDYKIGATLNPEQFEPPE